MIYYYDICVSLMHVNELYLMNYVQSKIGEILYLIINILKASFIRVVRYLFVYQILKSIGIFSNLKKQI